MNDRTHTTQLPNSSQLQQILAKEAERPHAHGKQDIHFPDFSTFIVLLEYLNIPTAFIKNNIPDEADNFIDRSRSVIDQVVSKILATSPPSPLLNNLYGYLSEQDEQEVSDLIFVFGAKTLSRIDTAVELYKNGYAKQLVISGGNPIYVQKTMKSEAEIYKNYALQKAVPKDAILIESKSLTIPDNVRSSLNMLDETNVNFSSIIIVNSPYSQRRGWAHFKKYLSDNIKIIRKNCSTIEKYSKDNWYKNEDGIRIYLNEFIKMKVAVLLNTA